jgi:hypothetical protein
MNSLLLATMLFIQAPVITTGNGTITGRILSTDGVPAAGVRVTAMTPRAPGQPEGVSVHSSITQTDGTGRYHLEDVPPGRYYITAGLLDAPTYYPGVSTLSTATVISVADGVPNEGVGFQLIRPTGLKVSGRIVSPEPGTFSAQTVALNRARVGAGAASASIGGGTSFEAQTDANGAFEFLRVPPGNYTLRVLSAGGMIEPTFVTVVDQEITHLEVRAAFLSELSGRVVLEDGSLVGPAARDWHRGATLQ